MAELEDAVDSKSTWEYTGCGFDSHFGHFKTGFLESDVKQLVLYFLTLWIRVWWFISGVL